MMRRGKSRNKPGPRGEGGFTVIELLVAMTILVIITLIVARLFQQAGVACTTGNNKVEAYMNGRAVAGYLADQLSRAVPAPDGSAFNVTTLPATFYVLDNASAGVSAIHQVTIQASDLIDPAQLKQVSISTCSGAGGSFPLYGTVSVTVSNTLFLSSFYFSNRDRNRL